MFNPWHEVPVNPRSPEVVTGLIEIPKGSRAKYEMDKQTGLLKLDRVLYSSVYYPANYGFIPQTYCGDGDPLDILILSQIDFVPLCLVEARVVGVMRMLDNNEADDKIIAVALHDVSVNHIHRLDELPPHFTSEMRHFFEEYKRLENRTVVIDDFLDHLTARQIVEQSIEDYRAGKWK
ncbi:MAG: inorganic diphosphatase [Saprospiraceae bacterium]|nr:inorganic diphosphatase [Saprospiraceae bacterium]